jgi:hypothetical protein
MISQRCKRRWYQDQVDRCNDDADDIDDDDDDDVRFAMIPLMLMSIDTIRLRTDVDRSRRRVKIWYLFLRSVHVGNDGKAKC